MRKLVLERILAITSVGGMKDWPTGYVEFLHNTAFPYLPYKEWLNQLTDVQLLDVFEKVVSLNTLK